MQTTDQKSTSRSNANALGKCLSKKPSSTRITNSKQMKRWNDPNKTTKRSKKLNIEVSVEQRNTNWTKDANKKLQFWQRRSCYNHEVWKLRSRIWTSAKQPKQLQKITKWSDTEIRALVNYTIKYCKKLITIKPRRPKVLYNTKNFIKMSIQAAHSSL